MALSKIVRPIAYCEIDPYCQSVLLSRMQTGDLPKAPIWDNIKTLQSFRGGIGLPSEFCLRSCYQEIDIIYGGFPCTDISLAGLGAGLAGKQSGLFFEIMRLAKEIKPKFLFLENVPAITTRGGLQVVREITEAGYDCRWCTLSAASVGALHKRERWFLLAYAISTTGGARGNVGDFTNQGWGKSKDGGKSVQSKDGKTCSNNPEQSSDDVANSISKRLENERPEQQTARASRKSSCNSDNITGGKAGESTESKHFERKAWREHTEFYRPFESREHWQAVVSEMGKCSNGVPNSLDRLRTLGNAVVPQQVRMAFEILSGLNCTKKSYI